MTDRFGKLYGLARLDEIDAREAPREWHAERHRIDRQRELRLKALKIARRFHASRVDAQDGARALVSWIETPTPLPAIREHCLDVAYSWTRFDSLDDLLAEADRWLAFVTEADNG